MINQHYSYPYEVELLLRQIQEFHQYIILNNVTVDNHLITPIDTTSPYLHRQSPQSTILAHEQPPDQLFSDFL
jgi:hypothetical protein